jgi:hypothetical protein
LTSKETHCIKPINDAGHRSKQQLKRPIFFSPGAFDDEDYLG